MNEKSAVMEDLEVTHDRTAFARVTEVDDEWPRATGQQVRQGVPRAHNRRVAAWTLSVLVALGVGLAVGATGSPREVPGPTVTVTPSSVPAGVDTKFGMSTREQYATMIFIEPGVQTVGQGAPPGTWVGVPLAADEICHWQRIRTDAAGRSIIVAEVLTNDRTVVTIRPDDNRFVSYGCRWVRQD